jgi:dihydroxyacetone kinase
MEADLNSLDAKVGDGDTGSTIATGARSLKAHISQLPLANTALLLSSISDLLGKSMGGSSGPVGHHVCRCRPINQGASDSVVAGPCRRASIAEGNCGAKTGDRTMIDALEPALAALASGKSLASAAIAREGADATTTMTRAGAGRSTTFYQPA